MIDFGLYTAIKILASVLIVVVLSLIAERAGPRVAGIASGFPLGTAISLYFIGLEIGPAFAARSAVFTAAGLAATLMFVAGYLLGLRLAGERRRVPSLLVAIPPALAAYGLAAWLLSLIPINIFGAGLMAFASILLADRYFRTIPDTPLEESVRLSFRATLLRAVFAAMVILAITTAARALGPGWAGLFSAFPITMLPLLAIIQFTYQPAHVRTIIKNIPRGLGALLIYTLVVAVSYARYGIGWGTVLGYLAATLYLVWLQHLKRLKPVGLPHPSN
jgi:hypothetical protein